MTLLWAWDMVLVFLVDLVTFPEVVALPVLPAGDDLVFAMSKLEGVVEGVVGGVVLGERRCLAFE